MAEDVAALEVLAVAGLLEDQVLGEVRGVVADVEARDEDVLRAAGWRRPHRLSRRLRTAPAPSSQKTPSCCSSSFDSGSAAQGSHQLMSQAYSRKTARMSSLLHLLGEHRLVEARRSRSFTKSGTSMPVGSLTVR